MARRLQRVLPRSTETRDLHTEARSESISYALKRGRAVEHRHPMLGLIYRVVAEVLMHERAHADDKPQA